MTCAPESDGRLGESAGASFCGEEHCVQWFGDRVPTNSPEFCHFAPLAPPRAEVCPQIILRAKIAAEGAVHRS